MVVVDPPAAPASAAPGRSVDTSVAWLRRLDVTQLNAVWPVRAIQAGTGGRAVLQCRVTPEGVLADCTVRDETPKGYGFGAAALLLTPNFLMKPATHDGRPVSGEVVIPVNFSGAPPVTDIPRASAIKVMSWAPWARSPSLEDVRRVFPAAAQARKVFGVVVFRCALAPDGALRDCDLTQETAPGVGFEAAARKLLPEFRARLAPDVGPQLKSLRTTVVVRFSPRSLDPSGAGWAAAPDWVKLVDADAVKAAFPAAARAAHVATGRALLDCAIGADGALTDCRADAETPRDLGFADAALKLAGGVRANLWSRDGEPLAGERVRLPLRIEDDPALSTTAAKPED